MKKDISVSRSYLVVKSNDLIQKSRFNLSLLEQKIILFLISRIKPNDMGFQEHTFEIADFCNTCGIDEDNGKNYGNVKKALQTLRDKSIWIELTDGSETTLAWLSRVTIDRRSGLVKLKIDDLMKPYLLQLQERFTQYEIIYILAMRSRYSVRLYELLKSHAHENIPIPIDIDKLKKQLFAETYGRFPDFKRKVLDIALREINELSDINASYEIGKDGRRFDTIIFSIKLKDLNGRLNSWVNIENRLNPKENDMDPRL